MSTPRDTRHDAPAHGPAADAPTAQQPRYDAGPYPEARGDDRTRQAPPAAGADHHGPTSRGPAVTAKTSAAAVFGLVFGLSALICVLTVLLAPVGLVLGIIGLVVALAGRVMSRRPGVTGRSVATGGLVLSVLAVLLSLALAAGATFFLNDDGAVERLEQQIADLRADLPEEIDVPQP